MSHARTLPDRQRIVLRSELTEPEKALLLVVTLYAGDDGRCFATVETLARDLSVTTRTIERRLKSLTSQGIIRTQRRKHHPAVRSIVWERLMQDPTPMSDQEQQDPTPTSGVDESRPDTHVGQDPTLVSVKTRHPRRTETPLKPPRETPKGGAGGKRSIRSSGNRWCRDDDFRAADPLAKGWEIITRIQTAAPGTIPDYARGHALAAWLHCCQQFARTDKGRLTSPAAAYRRWITRGEWHRGMVDEHYQRAKSYVSQVDAAEAAAARAARGPDSDDLVDNVLADLSERFACDPAPDDELEEMPL